MSVKDKIAVLQAWVEGHDIQVKLKGADDSCWFTVQCSNGVEPEWNWKWYDYRVKPDKPSINWDHVSKKYNYLAVSQFGAFLFRYKPDYCDGAWIGHDPFEGVSAEGFESLVLPKGNNYKDSLVQRVQKIKG